MYSKRCLYQGCFVLFVALLLSSQADGVEWFSLENQPTNDVIHDMAIGYKAGVPVVYAVASSALYKWDVEIMRWIVVTPPIDPTQYQPQAVATELNNPDVVYCGTYGAGVYKSTDGGNAWIEINNGLANQYVICLQIDPCNPDVIFAGCQRDLNNGPLYKTENCGEEWFYCGPDKGVIVNSIAINSLNSQIIYVGCCFAYKEKETDYYGIFQTEDGGLNWERKDDGINYPNIYSIAINPQNPSILYAYTPCGGGYPSTLYKTDNGGEEWFVNTNPPSVIWDIQFMPDRPDTIFCAILSYGVFRTFDDGNNWETCANGFQESASTQTLVIDYLNGVDNIYVDEMVGGAYFSPDCGDNWMRICNGLKVREISHVAVSTPTVIAVSKHGELGIDAVERSQDFGGEWVIEKDAGSGLINQCATWDRVNDRIFLSGRWMEMPPTSYILKGIEDGTQWEEVYHQIFGTQSNVTEVAFALEDPDLE